jgi:DNA modification methylase
VIALRSDRTVVGGHQRLVAARRLGMKTVPVTFVDLTLERARVLNLALNKISGTWDEELLARMVADLTLNDSAELALSGFTEGELDALLKSLDVREKRDKPEAFDVDAALDAARAATRAKPGEVWALGDHRMLVGDSTDTGALQRLLGETRPAMCFTDPPYNVAYGDHGGQQRGARKRRIQNDAMPPAEWEAFCRGWATNLVANVDGALYVCMSTKEWPVVSRILEEAGAHWSDTIVWKKDRFTLGRADYQRQYEPVWFGWREGAKHQWHGGRDQGDVWDVKRPSESAAHPTMKPLPLVERAIENSSSRGDVVLDLFLGSGTTMISAERTGRVCYGMELDAHYASVVLARWETFSGQVATCL